MSSVALRAPFRSILAVLILALAAVGIAAPARAAGASVATTIGTQSPTALTVQVAGTGFATTFPGVYVGISEADNFSNTDASRYRGTQWISNTQIAADGQWSTTLRLGADEIATLDPAKTYAVYTFKAHGIPDPGNTQTTQTPLDLDFVALGRAPKPTPTPTTTAPSTNTSTAAPTSTATPTTSAPTSTATTTTPSPTSTATPTTTATPTSTTTSPSPAPVPPGALGTMAWGIRGSFNSYVAGAGSISLAGVGKSGSAYTWPAVGTVDHTIRYSGSVHYLAHGGALDLTFSAPYLTLTSATSAQLTVQVTQPSGTARVHLADLTFAAPATTGATTQIKNAATRLTADGATAFGGFYRVGEALDPATFTVPSALLTGSGPGSPTPTSTQTSPAPTPSTPTGIVTGGSTGTSSSAAGQLIWAIHSGFRAYTLGPIANGSITVSGGAATSGEAFVFGQRSQGTVGAHGEGSTAYRGSVRFSGHGGLMNVAIADPTVRVTSAGSGVLSVLLNGSRVDFATLNLGAGNFSTSDGAITYRGVPATLTSAGASAFEGYYRAGERLAPVTFTIGTASSATGSAGPGGGSGTRVIAAAGGPSATSAGAIAPPAAAKPAAAQCTVQSASVVWGFKESFRSYVSGTIANGEWTTGGNASYATPDFSWAAGTGALDLTKGTGQIAFTGSVRFTGHHGAMDTTIADPVIRMRDPKTAVVILRVTSIPREAAESGASAAPITSTVEFVTLDLSKATRTVNGNVATLTNVPAALTAAGAQAFGTYPAGSAFDPLTLKVTGSPNCLGGNASGTPTSTSKPSVTSSAAPAPVVATAGSTGGGSGGFGWGVLVGGAGVALLGAGVLLTRRSGVGA